MTYFLQATFSLSPSSRVTLECISVPYALNTCTNEQAYEVLAFLRACPPFSVKLSGAVTFLWGLHSI